jgi:hypothetical protein
MSTAEKADKLAAHIAATVASWPAPTPEMVRKTTLLLRAAHAEKNGYTVPTYTEPPQVTAARKAADALAKIRREYAEAMDGCHGCGISRAAHKHQEGFGLGYHPFQPLSPDAAIKVAQSYKRKITAAEKAIANAR